MIKRCSYYSIGGVVMLSSAAKICHLISGAMCMGFFTQPRATQDLPLHQPASIYIWWGSIIDDETVINPIVTPLSNPLLAWAAINHDNMPPHEGLTHLKEYNIEDSNVELIGPDIDHKVKNASAETEPAWNDGKGG